MNYKEYMRRTEANFNRRNSINYYYDIDNPVNKEDLKTSNTGALFINKTPRADKVNTLKQKEALAKEGMLGILVKDGQTLDEVKEEYAKEQIINKRVLINNIKYLKSIVNKESEDFKAFIIMLDEEGEKTKEKAVDSYEKAEEIIVNIKLDKLFNVKLKKEFKSDIFNVKYKLYINKLSATNDEGKTIKKGYRLFIKTPTVWTDEIYYENYHQNLNIITLYSLFYDLDYIEALKDLMRIFNITIKGRLNTMLKKEKIKYANNTYFIREELSKYKNVYKLIGKYSFLLEHINYSSLKYTTDVNFKYEGNNIFYLPLRRLNKDMQELEEKLNIKITYKATGSLNRILNMFITLGLIKEVGVYSAEKAGLDTTKTGVNHYCKKFYTTITMDNKLLKKADKLAKKLLENKITTGTISYATLKDFDEELAKDIFQNTHNTIINQELVNKALKVDKEETEVAPVVDITTDTTNKYNEELMADCPL